MIVPYLSLRTTLICGLWRGGRVGRVSLNVAMSHGSSLLYLASKCACIVGS